MAARKPRKSRALAAAASGKIPFTTVYVHGIGSKPKPSVLKCQWDVALFGVEMGDRTRMAFWMDRERHPDFEDASCAVGDRVAVRAEGAAGMGARALEGDWLASTLDGLEAKNATERRVLEALARRMATGQIDTSPARKGRAPAVASVGAKALLLPPGLRKLVTRGLTQLFLGDVYDFLFDRVKRDAMKQVVLERLVGPGPFVVVAHSQGSMIAYQVLRELAKDRIRVPLFVTIGSPLGLAEVQDALKTFQPGRKLAVPECVDRWLNFADPFDPVAADPTLANDFSGGDVEDDRVWNPDSPRNPHSATGYLSTESVRAAVRGIVGPEFAQRVGSFVVARDLVGDIEDERDTRHPVLIELDTESEDLSLDEKRKNIVASIEEVVGKQRDDAAIDPLRHFVAASLTSSEVERLACQVEGLRIERIWRNATKRALLDVSSQRVQATAAHVAYAATGRDIHWAVLDTGICATHPHFTARKTIAARWNCTGTGGPRAHGEGDARADDGNGHGTHVAGIIAGGCAVELTLPRDGGRARIAGIAPDAKLHVYKVLDDDGGGRDAWIIKALEHVHAVNERAGRIAIAGVNLSLGGSFDPRVFGCGHSPLCQELRRLWRQGVLVCLAAGNEGYAVLQSEEGPIESNIDLSIGDPANLDEAIAVGSVHRDQPLVYGVSYFSSRGPTADGRRKPDLVAPGERIRSASHRAPAASPRAGDRAETYYVEMSGTSMAAPHVSGLLAAFLSARRELIGFPDRVKGLLLEHCTDLGRDAYIQGHGMPNLMRMLEST